MVRSKGIYIVANLAICLLTFLNAFLQLAVFLKMLPLFLKGFHKILTAAAGHGFFHNGNKQPVYQLGGGFTALKKPFNFTFGTVNTSNTAPFGDDNLEIFLYILIAR